MLCHFRTWFSGIEQVVIFKHKVLFEKVDNIEKGKLNENNGYGSYFLRLLLVG